MFSIQGRFAGGTKEKKFCLVTRCELSARITLAAEHAAGPTKAYLGLRKL